MNIRTASSSDAYTICQISRQDLGYECTSDLVLYRLRHLDPKREVVFVAEMDAQVVGYIHAEAYRLLYFESMVNILGIAVAATHRRLGVGKALLHQVEHWAKVMNIRQIRLHSGGTRKDAHQFYQSMGYVGQNEQLCFIKQLD